ncbi:hypothetical protein [Rhodoplanes sp. Z2-YC6860]|uniref:hypothetical protein n=1 Tax=Rhodoplanes sp. Z2-YC6860 TaxID=674703 RepID=UPI00082F518B
MSLVVSLSDLLRRYPFGPDAYGKGQRPLSSSASQISPQAALLKSLNDVKGTTQRRLMSSHRLAFRLHFNGATEGWFWDINALTFDLWLVAVMSRHAVSLENVKAKLRVAFNDGLRRYR